MSTDNKQSATDLPGTAPVTDAKAASTTAANPTKDGATKPSGQQPDWANGLRQLYDSVVEEPLPDSFNDLLSQLDNKA